MSNIWGKLAKVTSAGRAYTLAKNISLATRIYIIAMSYSPAVNAAFWWDAPVDRRTRQELELNLILKWRSPFNKENWERWGQPFG